jgi:epoxyqueuosine reductase
MHNKDSENDAIDYRRLAERIKGWAGEAGFAAAGISRAEVSAAAARLQQWLAQGCHGEMDYMAKHAELRAAPQALVPGTLTVISLRLPYLPASGTAASQAQLASPGMPSEDPQRAVISRYAQGRDYHKVIRNRLQKLAERIAAEIGPFGFRVFTDSAPVLEVELARQSGIAWRGKHTLSLTRQGSWHFLGEIFTDLPLPADQPIEEHCGSCSACLTACPTGAIVAPYQVDARRCISYLTIELHGAIPEPLRPLLGNRIYGCDDCQSCCPWNHFATPGDPAFAPRHGLDSATLVELFAWTAAEFEERLAGNPIRRIGHERWLRNIAVALGNLADGEKVAAATLTSARTALTSRQDDASPLVREHVAWALARLSAPETQRKE